MKVMTVLIVALLLSACAAHERREDRRRDRREDRTSQIERMQPAVAQTLTARSPFDNYVS